MSLASSRTTSKEPWKLGKLTLPVLKLAFSSLFKFYSKFLWFHFCLCQFFFPFFIRIARIFLSRPMQFFASLECKKRHYFTRSKGGQLNETSLFFLNALKGMQTLPEWESYHLRRAFKGKTLSFNLTLALTRVKKTQKNWIRLFRSPLLS